MTSTKLTSEHVKKVNDLLNVALGMKDILRQTSPNHILDAITEKHYVDLVKILERATETLYEGVIATRKSGSVDLTIQNGVVPPLPESSIPFDEFQKRTENVLFVVSSASNKNLLKKIGIPPSNIIETGGPLTLDDADKLRPDLPEQARTGITKHIEAFWQQVSKRISQVTPSQILLVLEATQETDKLLGLHAEDFKARFTLNTSVKNVPGLKDINWKQFCSVLF